MVLRGLMPFLFARKEGTREGSRTIARDLAAGDRRRAREARQTGRRSGRGGTQDAGAAGHLEPGSVSRPAVPKPTPANLRRFAETPIVRRAINVIKDRIAAMDWQIRVRRGVAPATWPTSSASCARLRRTLEEPNAVDSFRTLIEQVIEDALTGGFGAIEMEPTGDPERPAMLWPVDGASIRINATWDGQPDTPRYAQAMPGQLGIERRRAAATTS